MKRSVFTALAFSALTLGTTGGVEASGNGIFDQAKTEQGCGCHDYGPTNLPVSPTIVKMLVDGTPAEEFVGFTPGSSYELTVWVIGPVVPFAGFNLQASAGTLATTDTSVKAIVHTECERMERLTALPQCRASNPAAGKECKVRQADGCPVFDPANPACQRCDPTDEGFGDDSVCRLCDGQEIVDVQATHTEPKPLPFFTVTWTAPDDGTSEVTFHLAGNSVERAVGNPTLDIWNFSDPYPIVLERAP